MDNKCKCKDTIELTGRDIRFRGKLKINYCKSTRTIVSVFEENYKGEFEDVTTLFLTKPKKL